MNTHATLGKSILGSLLILVLMMAPGRGWGQTLVGSGQTYTTLKSAFDAINAGTLTGNVVLQITSNTTETATAALNATGGSANYSTVTIYPAGSGYTVSGSVAGALIQLNGADNVTINGSLNQGNVFKDLTISNTNTGGQSLVFINDATSNIVKYCFVKGVNSSTSSGVVVFSTTTGTTGNDGNTIDNCDISDGASTPTNCLYASGTLTSVAHNNSGITISNCNIFNFFSAGSATNGIFLSTGNTDWTIDNNKFYQTSSRTYTSANTHRAIQIINSATGNNFDIKNNVIGYSSNTATGTYTLAGTIATRFIGIELAVGNTTASSIQNNSITNFSLATSSGAGTTYGIWCGIFISAGSANIGTITGNTIGSTSAVDLISCTPTTSGALIAGISSTSAGTVNINNNNIGALTGLGSASIGTLIKGILFTSGTITLSGNTIGSLSTANSLRAGVSGTTTALCSTIGIDNSSSGTVLITGNSIGNNTNNGSNVNSISAGIKSSSGTVTIEKNIIHSLVSNSTNLNILINGIYITGTSATGTVKNNMVRLGSDASGTSVNSYQYNGIYEIAGTCNYYFNSVYIGGNSTGSSTANTYAFNSGGSGNPRVFQNNIFVNSRTNTTGSGKHYAIKTGTGAGLNCDYNIFYHCCPVKPELVNFFV
jgi:hypothetical protein